MRVEIRKDGYCSGRVQMQFSDGGHMVWDLMETYISSSISMVKLLSKLDICVPWLPATLFKKLGYEISPTFVLQVLTQHGVDNINDDWTIDTYTSSP